MKITTKVTSRNRVTVPAAVVSKLGIVPGMQVEWILNEDRSVTLRPILSREERVMQLQGMLRPFLKPGDDPIGDLIRERVEEDEEYGLNN